MKDTCIILGGGGHARVLIDCIQVGGAAKIYGILDPDKSRWGQVMLDVPILGDDDLITEMVAHGVHYFVVGLGSAGNTLPRRRLFELGLANGLEPLTVVHPSSIHSARAAIGPGAQLLPGSIINAGAVISKNVIINSSAVVEHDCVIEDHVHIASGAKLASTVNVREGAHIGVGAVIRQGITVGEGAVVGAGAVVVKDVPPRVVVVGVPAHFLRVT
jgi:UDP-perosamine 4-acetyltransferase